MAMACYLLHRDDYVKEIFNGVSRKMLSRVVHGSQEQKSEEYIHKRTSRIEIELCQLRRRVFQLRQLGEGMRCA